MKTAKEIGQDFEKFLEGLKFTRQPENLYAPVNYVLSLGGKRLRPTLLLMAYDMYAGGKTGSDVYNAAAGIEIFHNFTLLHDDLMDNADMRRGHLTVHRKWNDNTAILSGDAMLVLAYDMLFKIDAKYLPRVLDIANRCFNGIMEGQQYDMDFENRDDVTVNEYIEMIRLKTSILLAASLEMGAVLGGASSTDASLLYSFGENIGLAFQLQDDLLDVYGDPAVFGKKIGGDILCNKKTYLYINAYLLADERQKASLDRWAAYNGNDPEAKIAGVRAIYDEVKVRQLSEQLIGSYFDKAIAFLDKVNMPDNRKAALRDYANTLLNRQI